jgi:hypothetical protein
VESSYAREITEGLFRECSTLWHHKYESPMIVSKALFTLTGGPLNLEDLVFILSSLYVKPELHMVHSVIIIWIYKLVFLFLTMQTKNQMENKYLKTRDLNKIFEFWPLLKKTKNLDKEKMFHWDSGCSVFVYW